MPIEIEWKLRAAAFCRIHRMLQGPALGSLLEYLGSVLGGLCCTLPPSVVQSSVVLRTDGLWNNLLFLHRLIFIKSMSRVSYLCLFLTSQVLCLSYFSYDITKEDGEKVVH